MAKRVNYKTYEKKFKNFVKKGVPVTGIKYDTEVSEIIQDVNEFRQCYNPHFKIRKQLPKYWFISKEGFLIRVNGKEPKWVSPNLKAWRPQFKPSSSVTGWPKNKPISTYDLVALTWGSFISDDAYYLLDKEGAVMLGRLDMDEKDLHRTKIQGHHWKVPYIHENTIEAYVKNNDPTNIQIVTNRQHHFLKQLESVDFKETYRFHAPKYRNVRAEEVDVYIIDDGKPRMEKLENLIITKVVNLTKELSDQDCLEVEDYLFVSTNGADFIEAHKELLLSVAKLSHGGQNFEIHDGKKYYYVDANLVDEEPRRIFYRKIK